MKQKLQEVRFLFVRSLQLDRRFFDSNVPIRTKEKIHFVLLKYFLTVFQIVTTFKPGISHVKWQNKLVFSDSRVGGIAGLQAVWSEHMAVISKLEPPSKEAIVLDVGANVGYFSKAISDMFDETKIYSFEPSNLSVDIFMKNCPNFTRELDFSSLSLWGNPRVVFELALMEHDGIYQFIEDPQNPALTRVVSMNESLFSDEAISKVSGVSGKSFLDGIKPPFTIHLLKVDVEGNELKVLRGLGDYLRRVKYLYIELNSDVWDFSELVSILFDNGLDFRLINLRSFQLNPSSVFINGDLVLELFIRN